MAPRLSGQTSIFGVVFFVSKSLLGIEGQMLRKPRSHTRILIYRTWPIDPIASFHSVSVSIPPSRKRSGFNNYD